MFKNIILIVVSGLFFGCSPHHSDVSISPEPEKPIKMKGVHYMYDSDGLLSGVVEIIKTRSGFEIYQESHERLISKNANDTYGQHSSLNTRINTKSKEVLLIAKDINYNSNQDLESQIDNSNLTGKHYTTILFTIVNNKINLKITIYSGCSNCSGGINKPVHVSDYTSK